MICFDTMSGLGNQLFKYAFARAMQLDTGEEIVVYIRHGLDKEAGSIASCKLPDIVPSEIDISYVDCPGEDTASFIKKFAPIRYGFYRVGRMLLRISKGIYKKDLKKMSVKEQEEVNKRIISAYMPVSDFLGVYEYMQQYYPCKPGKVFKKKFFSGNFFSAQYFNRYSEQIHSELRRPELIPERSADLLEKIRSCNAVFVHMRFGDYLSEQFKKFLFVCDVPYFEKAIRRAARELDDPVFFLFSDSPDIAATVQLPEGTEAVLVPSDHSAIEDLELMAQCKHAIISNSTFSWWGQFLIDNPEERVYAPEPWDREGVLDMFYQDFWTRIPVDLPPL